MRSAVRRTIEGRALVTGSVGELALLEGETGGRGESAGESAGAATGEAAGEARGRRTSGSREAARRRAVGELALVEG